MYVCECVPVCVCVCVCVTVSLSIHLFNCNLCMCTSPHYNLNSLYSDEDQQKLSGLESLMETTKQLLVGFTTQYFINIEYSLNSRKEEAVEGCPVRTPP